MEKINTSKDLAIMIKKNFIVIIKITAEECGICKDKIFIESYNKLKLYYSNNPNIKFVELDINNDLEILHDKKYYHITNDYVPSFLITKNGSFIKKYIGANYFHDINNYILETLKLKILSSSPI